MLLGAVWPTIPAALPESVSPADLVGSGRDAEAAEQLRGAIALRPFEAEAYWLLGGLLGERWERRALRTRSTDFGVRESDVPEPELRAEAVDALTSSVQLQPSAHVHAVIGNLLTPNGRAATAHDMQQAVDHLQAALTLDSSVHAGTIHCTRVPGSAVVVDGHPRTLGVRGGAWLVVEAAPG